MQRDSTSKRITALEVAQQATARDPQSSTRLRGLLHGESVPAATDKERASAARIIELLAQGVPCH